MVDKAFLITDMIDGFSVKQKLDKIKEKIKSDYDAKGLIDKFYHAKENYEKYNLKEEFIKTKENMLKNELIKEYVMIQNKINMLTLQINNRIDKITKKHY